MARECGDTDMEAFYASLKAEITSSSQFQDTLPNNVSLRTRSGVVITQISMKFLREFVSTKFSLLLHPVRSGLLKDAINYLLIFPPDEGFSMRKKSLLQQLLLSFDQWSLDYDHGKLKLKSATEDLSEAEKIQDDLQANLINFNLIDIVEKCYCNRLHYLEEEKGDVEENVKRAQIAKSTIMRDMAAKRKIDLFHNGREMKAKRDDLKSQVLRLKAEQEWAKMRLANIEAEWLKFGKQFNDSIGFLKSGY